MKAVVEKNMLKRHLLVQFEIDEYELSRWLQRRFGNGHASCGSLPPGEMLYLLTEFYNFTAQASPIAEVQVDVLEPVPSLPPAA
jgi:hypothetical protein